MAAVMMIASASVAVPDGPARATTQVASFVDYRAAAPKPCRKGVMPGAATACQFSAISQTTLPGSDDISARTDSSRELVWQLADASLCSQCGRSSPYRPPALTI